MHKPWYIFPCTPRALTHTSTYMRTHAHIYSPMLTHVCKWMHVNTLISWDRPTCRATTSGKAMLLCSSTESTCVSPILAHILSTALLWFLYNLHTPLLSFPLRGYSYLARNPLFAPNSQSCSYLRKCPATLSPHCYFYLAHHPLLSRIKRPTIIHKRVRDYAPL
jgi:hypothetical protein